MTFFYTMRGYWLSLFFKWIQHIFQEDKKSKSCKMANSSHKPQNFCQWLLIGDIPGPSVWKSFQQMKLVKIFPPFLPSHLHPFLEVFRYPSLVKKFEIDTPCLISLYQLKNEIKSFLTKIKYMISWRLIWAGLASRFWSLDLSFTKPISLNMSTLNRVNYHTFWTLFKKLAAYTD